MKKFSYKTLEWLAEVCVDLGGVALAGYLAFLMTVPGFLDAGKTGMLADYLMYALPLVIVVYALCGVYRQMWRYVRISGLIRISLAAICFTGMTLLAGRLAGAYSPSFYITSLFMIVLITWIFRARKPVGELFRRYFSRMLLKREGDGAKDNILIVGAGYAAAILVHQFDSHGVRPVHIVGMVDDDRSKTGLVLHGIKVLGECRDIAAIVDTYCVDDIIIAIPSINAQQLQVILQYCKDTKCRVKIMPHFDRSLGNFRLEDLRVPNINDLIGRQEFRIDTDSIGKTIRNKTVLVTGGGGSIGSELCRQIMRFKPARLIILDIYENSTYDLYKELMDTYGGSGETEIEVRIGSVLNEKEVELLFFKYRPNLVFHAAAYKHVPLMEICPREAIKNNIFGTYQMAQIAIKYEVEKFLLISTDKAVNPTNIMGATKRAAELIVEAMQGRGKTDFVAVRFGNVLGSNGSVVVQFNRQISTGGPVTVTHPEIIRYFMTISEAVSLVLETMTLAHGGELFVLDMGSPVKIDSLARRMIEIAGLRPGVDIEIQYTGLRPGEKLYEELLIEEEGIAKTENNKIFITQPKNVGIEYVQKMIHCLSESLNNDDNVKETLKVFIDSFMESKEPEAADMTKIV